MTCVLRQSFLGCSPQLPTTPAYSRPCCTACAVLQGAGRQQQLKWLCRPWRRPQTTEQGVLCLQPVWAASSLISSSMYLPLAVFPAWCLPSVASPAGCLPLHEVVRSVARSRLTWEGVVAVVGQQDHRVPRVLVRYGLVRTCPLLFA
jgi:hypothetical protein